MMRGESQLFGRYPGNKRAMVGARRIRTFDLFCGAGGSSCGAKQAGAEVAGGVDLWPTATRTFHKNFPKAKVYTGDIRRLPADQVACDVGRIDLLLASPECTHHSIAKGSAPRDETSKQLAFEVVRFAKAMQPRWIVVENVIQMERWPAFDHWRTHPWDLPSAVALESTIAQRRVRNSAR
jgi:DNA (cytosine-5)-methyltransferase 1